MNGYLNQLTLRLTAAMAALPEEVRQRHDAYLIAAQRDDGGFAGREGDSDIYYTSFAMRSMAMLGSLYGEPAERAAGFLRGRMTGRESIVDFLSLIYASALLESAAGIDIFADSPAGWRDSVAAALAELRRDDGGYAKGAQGAASSTYHTFLVQLCSELIERPLPNTEQMVAFLMSQQCEEGGFREIRASKRPGVNPTAAAVGALRSLDALPDDASEGVIDFLAEMQTDEGGIRANTRIPIADLLSTFTGCLTLIDLGALEEIEPAAALRYAKSLELPEGGFHGAVWDEACDVEYTFYGLGCLALLHERVDPTEH